MTDKALIEKITGYSKIVKVNVLFNGKIIEKDAIMYKKNNTWYLKIVGGENK